MRLALRPNYIWVFKENLLQSASLEWEHVINPTSTLWQTKLNMYNTHCMHKCANYFAKNFEKWEFVLFLSVDTPCGTANGNCSHLCLLSGTSSAGYSCACPRHYRLSQNKRDCYYGENLLSLVQHIATWCKDMLTIMPRWTEIWCKNYKTLANFPIMPCLS